MSFNVSLACSKYKPCSSFTFILNESSMNIIAFFLSEPASPAYPSYTGFEKAKTKKTISIILNNKRSSCLSLIFFNFDFWISFINIKVLNSTLRTFLRLKRCIRIGIAIAADAINMRGFRKDILFSDFALSPYIINCFCVYKIIF